MLRVIPEKKREANRIRLIRCEGRLVFDAAGRFVIAPAQGLAMGPEAFQALVDYHTGGSIPETNSYFYVINRARANARKGHKNITLETHVSEHKQLWMSYYQACLEKFTLNEGSQPPPLPSELQVLIQKKLDEKNYSEHWRFTDGILEHVINKSSLVSKRQREEELDLTQEDAIPANSSTVSSSALMYSALVDTRDANRPTVKIKRTALQTHASSAAMAAVRYATLIQTPELFVEKTGIEPHEFEHAYNVMSQDTKWKSLAPQAIGLREDKDRLLALFIYWKNENNVDPCADVASAMQCNEDTIRFITKNFAVLVNSKFYRARYLDQAADPVKFANNFGIDLEGFNQLYQNISAESRWQEHAHRVPMLKDNRDKLLVLLHYLRCNSQQETSEQLAVSTGVVFCLKQLFLPLVRGAYALVLKGLLPPPLVREQFSALIVSDTPLVPRHDEWPLSISAGFFSPPPAVVRSESQPIETEKDQAHAARFVASVLNV